MASINPIGIDQTSGKNRALSNIADVLTAPQIVAPNNTNLTLVAGHAVAGSPGDAVIKTDNPISPGLPIITRYLAHTKNITLTNATPLNLFQVTVGTNLSFACRINYQVYARDSLGTDNQIRAGQAGVMISCGNSSGVCAVGIDPGTSGLGATTGTLTVSFSVPNTPSTFTVSVTATTSLSNPALSIVYSLLCDQINGSDVTIIN